MLSEPSQAAWGLACERSIRTITCSARRLSLGSEWGHRAGRQGAQDHIFHHSHFCLGLVSSACVHAVVIQYLSLNLNTFELVFWGIHQLRHLRPLAMGHKMHLTCVWYKYLPLYWCIALFHFAVPMYHTHPYPSLSSWRNLEKFSEQISVQRGNNFMFIQNLKCDRQLNIKLIWSSPHLTDKGTESWIGSICSVECYFKSIFCSLSPYW